MEEIYVDVTGFVGLYKISNRGSLLSVKFRNSRHLNPTINAEGYYYAFLRKDGRYHSFPIHRLIAIHFIPNPLDKKQVNHKNGNKSDNRIENLEWVTNQENAIHAFKHGLRRANKPYSKKKYA